MAVGVGASTLSLLGREIGGYRVVRELGVGGMGVVYLAEHRLIGRRAAIKVIRPEVSSDPSFGRRFLLEARAVAGLDHPGIVRIYDFDFEEDIPYLVMEYVTGQRMDELLLQTGPLTPAEAVSLLRPVAEALDHAHSKGVVHRDVKPANVLLAQDGRTLVMDFGLACLQDQVLATDQDAFLGTPDYIAPEQIKGPTLGGGVDLYSLAAMTYEIVTGDKPFHGRNWIEIASKRLLEPPPVATGVPEKFARAIERGMSRNPDDRPGSCVALLDSFEKALGRRPPAVHPSAEPLLFHATAGLGITATCLAAVIALEEIVLFQGPAMHAGILAMKALLGR